MVSNARCYKPSFKATGPVVLETILCVCNPVLVTTFYERHSSTEPWPGTPSAMPPSSLSTPMGIDYVVIGSDMEVQPLVTQNAA